MAFLDLATVAEVSPLDGIHFDAAAQPKIAAAVADALAGVLTEAARAQSGTASLRALAGGADEMRARMTELQAADASVGPLETSWRAKQNESSTAEDSSSTGD